MEDMINTGITRKVDELGRIVIPKELRNNLVITEETPLDIYIDKEKIILIKHKASECWYCLEKIDKTDSFCKHCGTKQKGVNKE